MNTQRMWAVDLILPGNLPTWGGTYPGRTREEAIENAKALAAGCGYPEKPVRATARELEPQS